MREIGRDHFVACHFPLANLEPKVTGRDVDRQP
jgi:hypothetical protein